MKYRNTNTYDAVIIRRRHSSNNYQIVRSLLFPISTIKIVVLAILTTTTLIIVFMLIFLRQDHTLTKQRFKSTYVSKLNYDNEEYNNMNEIIDLVIDRGSTKTTNNNGLSTSFPSNITIVVLGEMLQKDGTATQNLHSRIRTTYNLMHQLLQYQHQANVHIQQQHVHIIFSGGDTAQVNQTEASIMKVLWDSYTSSDNDYDSNSHPLITITLEVQSLSTCQNAFYSIPIITKIHNFNVSDTKTRRTRTSSKPLPLLIVTSDYHVARAKLLFEQVFRTEGMHIFESTTIIGVPAKTYNTTERQRLFTNERYWLQHDKLRLLLTQLKDHPFILPTLNRVEQARTELDQMEGITTI